MSSGKSSRKVREEARNKALEALSPHLLSAAEDVGEAEYEYRQAMELAEAKAENYRRAWDTALQHGWNQTQLSQVVQQKPPRPRRSGRANSEKPNRSVTSTGGAATTDEQDDPSQGAVPSPQLAEPSPGQW